MAWTKLLPEIGSIEVNRLNERLRYHGLSVTSPIGSCCGAAVVFNFPSGYINSIDETPRNRKFLMDRALASISRGAVPIDPDDSYEEEYDEELDDWVTPEIHGETVPQTPAIAMAFLAGSQVPDWHDTLIEAGFRCVAYGQLNPKSDPNPIATYMATFESSDVITNGGLYENIGGQARMATPLDMPEDIRCNFDNFSPA